MKNTYKNIVLLISGIFLIYVIIKQGDFTISFSLFLRNYNR